jgi:hypothetical protein
VIPVNPVKFLYHFTDFVSSDQTIPSWYRRSTEAASSLPGRSTGGRIPDGFEPPAGSSGEASLEYRLGLS